MGYVKGDLIKLRAFGGKRIVRRFVEERGGSILICSHEEYELALLEKREPLCIGFRPENIIEESRKQELQRRPRGKSVRSKAQAPNYGEK
ncbi:MAG TPA: hypothetical protein VEW46_22195 [Pyrinomonadaceae bacterium]|nr:hypothetical protein [Pyrinomonadaceae bacterium]